MSVCVMWRSPRIPLRARKGRASATSWTPFQSPSIELAKIEDDGPFNLAVQSRGRAALQRRVSEEKEGGFSPSVRRKRKGGARLQSCRKAQKRKRLSAAEVCL